MVCIYCGSKTSIVNSRPQHRINATWRRHHCKKCGATFTTQEQVDLSSSVAFKAKSGKLQPFKRQMLFLSLYESLRHRPGAAAEAAALTNTIIAKVLPSAQKDATVLRSELVKTAQTVLKRFDTAAAVHYNAFHPSKITS